MPQFKLKSYPIKAWQYTGGSDQLESWRFQEWVKDELPDYVDKLFGAQWVASTDVRPIFNIEYTHNTDNNIQYMPLMEFPLDTNEWFIFIASEELGNIPFRACSNKTFKAFFEEV